MWDNGINEIHNPKMIKLDHQSLNKRQHTMEMEIMSKYSFAAEKILHTTFLPLTIIDVDIFSFRYAYCI